MMNAGATLDDILYTHSARLTPWPDPRLRPVYVEPEFVIRNIWRLYGAAGGTPTRLV